MKLKLLMAAALCPLLGFSQLSLVDIGETYQIDFDNAMSGINQTAIQGVGFTSGGSAGGALNSDGIIYTGLSSVPASITWGGTATSDQAARGISDGRNNNMIPRNASSFGLYAFNTNNGASSTADYCLGWFSDGNVFDPGEIILKVKNDGASALNVIRLAYEGKYLNLDPSSTNVNVSYSTNGGSSYTVISGMDFSTPNPVPSGGAVNATWVSVGKTAVISGLNIPAGTGEILIKWTSAYTNNFGGYGDLVGIDDITIRGYAADYLFSGGVWTPSEPSGSLTTSNALVLKSNAPNAVAPISTSTNLLNLFIESEGKVQVKASADLTVAGKLFLYADGNGYAQIRGLVSGNAVYQTYREATAGKWMNMAIPVDATYDDVEGIFIQTDPDPTKTNLWRYDATTPATGTDGTWTAVTDKALAETEEEAYLLYGGDGTYFGSGPFEIEVEGLLVESPVSIPVTGVVGNRYNLIPNPFACAIDWQDVRPDNTGLGATYYIQDGNPSLGDIVYRTWTWNSTGAAGGERQIPPGQAFYVLVNETNPGTITIDTSHQDVSYDRSLYKTAATPGLMKVMTTLIGTEYSDEAIVYFESSYSDNYEFEKDGFKRMNTGYPNLYTKSSDNVDLVSNGMNDAFTTKDVDLYFQGDKAGNYKVELSYDGIPAEWTVILEDKMLGNFTNLKKSGYGFTHAVGASPDRFVLHFNTAGAVGVPELEASEVFSFVSNQNLTVNLDGLSNADITVYDVAGRVVAESNNQNGAVSFDMTDWANGVYVVNVISNEKLIHTNKVVK